MATRPGERLHFAMERSTMLLMGKSTIQSCNLFFFRNIQTLSLEQGLVSLSHDLGILDITKNSSHLVDH